MIKKKKENYNFKVKDLVKETNQTDYEKKKKLLLGKKRYNDGMKKLKDDEIIISFFM